MCARVCVIGCFIIIHSFIHSPVILYKIWSHSSRRQQHLHVYQWETDRLRTYMLTLLFVNVVIAQISLELVYILIEHKYECAHSHTDKKKTNKQIASSDFKSSKQVCFGFTIISHCSPKSDWFWFDRWFYCQDIHTHTFGRMRRFVFVGGGSDGDCVFHRSFVECIHKRKTLRDKTTKKKRKNILFATQMKHKNRTNQQYRTDFAWLCSAIISRFLRAGTW